MNWVPTDQSSLILPSALRRIRVESFSLSTWRYMPSSPLLTYRNARFNCPPTVSSTGLLFLIDPADPGAAIMLRPAISAVEASKVDVRRLLLLVIVTSFGVLPVNL